MQTINSHEAKTRLSRLADDAAKGKAFIIARAGKPMSKVLPVSGFGYRSLVAFISGILLHVESRHTP